jgi:hypothetical protein
VPCLISLIKISSNGLSFAEEKVRTGTHTQKTQQQEQQNGWQI